MLGKLLDALAGRKTLLDEARQEAVMMLAADRRMFELVLLALKGDASQQIRSRIRAMDKDINRQQRDVRAKVFEHLTFSRGQDLLQGLELITAVIDLERIGDYTKNMSELVEMVPGELSFGEYESTYQEVEGLAIEMFDHCMTGFTKSDTEAARMVLERYSRLSMLCDSTLKELLSSPKAQDEKLDKTLVGLILLMRYLKRVGAHLKNLASALTNPFHRIGFRPKS